MASPFCYVLTTSASATRTWVVAVEVNAGSVPVAPPPDQVTFHVIVALTVKTPPGTVRDEVR
jgi:hypothetical protein